MALDMQIARIAKLLVDSEGISFDQAQERLRALTLEIIVAEDASSPAAHAAVLTAVLVGRRTFIGGVRIVGAVHQPLNSALPLKGPTLKDAAMEIGASTFSDTASYRIVVGTVANLDADYCIRARWDGWVAGISRLNSVPDGTGENPLTGIVAGALAVGKAFEAMRGLQPEFDAEVNLWPNNSENHSAPKFGEVFLPGALWLIGLGNLGQAYLWALAALPYSDPSDVSIVLQDRDVVTPENWSTSVLITDEKFGCLKTRVAEQWAIAKRFNVRRLDRFLRDQDMLEDGDPVIALSGVDKIEARRLMRNIGFDCIIDAGLGRTSKEYDRYRVTLFDQARSIHTYFTGQNDANANNDVPKDSAYQILQKEIGRCGTVEIAGASIAVPYVSAITAAIAISRSIAVTSGCECPMNEVGKIASSRVQRVAKLVKFNAVRNIHAGRPRLIKERSDKNII